MTTKTIKSFIMSEYSTGNIINFLKEHLYCTLSSTPTVHWCCLSNTRSVFLLLFFSVEDKHPVSNINNLNKLYRDWTLRKKYVIANTPTIRSVKHTLLVNSYSIFVCTAFQHSSFASITVWRVLTNKPSRFAWRADRNPFC